MIKTVHRLIGFTIGLLAFTAVHLIEVQMWVPWFGGDHNAWFLNDQHAGQFTFVGLFIISLIAGWFRLSGSSVAFGACVAMTLALFLSPHGPGSLFPMALGIGGTLVVIACWPATLIGKELRGWVTRRHRMQ